MGEHTIRTTCKTTKGVDNKSLTVLQSAMKAPISIFYRKYLRQPKYKRRLPLEKRLRIRGTRAGTEGLSTANNPSFAAGFSKAERTIDADPLERYRRSSECDLGISCEVEGAVAQGGALALENELFAELRPRFRQVKESLALEIDLVACQLSVGQKAQLCDRAGFDRLQACTTIRRP